MFYRHHDLKWFEAWFEGWFDQFERTLSYKRLYDYWAVDRSFFEDLENKG